MQNNAWLMPSEHFRWQWDPFLQAKGQGLAIAEVPVGQRVGIVVMNF
jgi:hypothetical protein